MIKDPEKHCLAILSFCIGIILMSTQTEAEITLNGLRDFTISGKIETKVAVFTQGAGGNTWPKHEKGNLMQHRSLIYLQIEHLLKKDETGDSWEVKYHLLGRGLYEGIYDYGPEIYQDVADTYSDRFDDVEKDLDLWEGYVDLSKGAAFFRFGKQNLSWGETDNFRLLDNINPLDNTWGGSAEDLDDRRIPLWMIRASYGFGMVGPIHDLSLDGFLSPGIIEDEVAPRADFTPFAGPSGGPTPGNPVSHPFGPPWGAINKRLYKPDKDMAESRFGFRLQGTTGNFGCSLAFYKSYVDIPGIRFGNLNGTVNDINLNPGNPGTLELQSLYDLVTIAGGSFNYYNLFLDSVFKGEIAFMKDHPVFIPEINTPQTGGFTAGQATYKDFVNFSLAVEKKLWIRFINRGSMVSTLYQYFGSYMKDWDDRTRYPFFDPDKNNSDRVVWKRFEQIHTFMAKTDWGGLYGAQVLFVYDPRGSYMLAPHFDYKLDPFRIRLGYRYMGGNLRTVGFSRDRDNVYLRFTLLF